MLKLLLKWGLIIRIFLLKSSTRLLVLFWLKNWTNSRRKTNARKRSKRLKARRNKVRSLLFYYFNNLSFCRLFRFFLFFCARNGVEETVERFSNAERNAENPTAGIQRSAQSSGKLFSFEYFEQLSRKRFSDFLGKRFFCFDFSCAHLTDKQIEFRDE